MADLKPKGNRIKIITGHFGSGKTEFSINYCLFLKKYYEKVAAIDLDIINMYFRIREKTEFLENNGVEVYGSIMKKMQALDIPAVDPQILMPLEREEYQVVMDIGGNPKGTLSLGRYRELLHRSGYDNYFIINRNRPETAEVSDIIAFIKSTEAHSQTRINGLINTTHMLKDTTVDDVLYGQEIVEEVSKLLNIPVVYTTCIRPVAEQLEKENSIKNEIFPIDLYFRDDWMI